MVTIALWIEKLFIILFDTPQPLRYSIQYISMIRARVRTCSAYHHPDDVTLQSHQHTPSDWQSFADNSGYQDVTLLN